MKLPKISNKNQCYSFTTKSLCVLAQGYKRMVTTHEGNFVEFSAKQINPGCLCFSKQPKGKGYFVWSTDCDSNIEVRQQKMVQPGTPLMVNYYYVNAKDLVVNGETIDE